LLSGNPLGRTNLAGKVHGAKADPDGILNAQQ
jgi:hypothetical protein